MVIWLISESQDEPNGDKCHDVQSFECDVVDQRIGQHGMDRPYEFSRKRSILHFVCKGMDDDVTRDLVDNQERHVVCYEIIGSESIHTPFAVGDACPNGEIDNGGDQPVQQIHDQVGTVLPLLCPVHLPES